jgi:hypothetical protein
MITCPYCGTSYEKFQSFCSQCGGILPEQTKASAEPAAAVLPVPPRPPRVVPRHTALRILLTDGLAIASLVLLLLGTIFGLLGIALTISVVAAFVGLPFAALGVLFLAVGVPILLWRLIVARRRVTILEEGQVTKGEIVNVRQEYRVRVNGRHPWVIDYTYRVGGTRYDGKMTTLDTPGLNQQAGQAAHVLYLGNDPSQSTLYLGPGGHG